MSCLALCMLMVPSELYVMVKIHLLAPCVRRLDEKREKLNDGKERRRRLDERERRRRLDEKERRRRLDEKEDKLKKRRRRLDENGEKLTVQSKQNRLLDEKGDRLNVRKKGRRITTLSSLPDELLQEILSKLPVRVLNRFKCVCKLWGDLISSQEFIRLHLNKYATSVILVNSVSECDRVRGGHGSICPIYPPSTLPNAINSVDFTLPGGFREMTSACNGIICLWDTEKHCSLESSKQRP